MTGAILFALCCSVLAFFAGVLVGVYWIPDKIARRIAEVIGRLGQTRRVSSDPAPAADPDEPDRRFNWRTAAILLLSVSLIANLVVGILLIVTRAQVEQQDTDRVAFVKCQQTYNERSGRANDARDARSKETTDAAIDVWHDIVALNKSAEKNPQGTEVYLHQLFKSIHHYVIRLRATQRTRDNVPFPPADLCTNLGQEVHTK